MPNTRGSMTTQRWRQVEDVFLAAIERSGAEREEFLRQACDGDADLRRKVDAMLAHDPEDGARISAVIEQAVVSTMDENLDGVRIGAYRIESQLGRGGMGSVYLATRDDAEFHKTVAIKVIRRGMDSADVLGRFRQERQILAQLDHPYIARLLDGGRTQDGRPYLVMEFVQGRPIQEYWERLSLEERLKLFCQVCEAVSHAHRSLVVHRDLKPANILVTASGSPKLLDFGIAKLMQAGPEEEDNGLTRGAVRPLTPEYSSPEQVLGRLVTTATDIYSLGLLLFEMLAGVKAQRMGSYTTHEVERMVCEAPAARPSEVAADRAWARRLRGDLDNIVLMALRKEPERRYASVEQFAGDVQRYLHGLPVLAREDTLRYRAGKFLKRNRTLVGGIALAFVALAAVACVALVEARRAQHALEQAQLQTAIAEEQSRRAEASRQSAEQEHAAAAQQRDRAVAETQRASDRLHQLVGLSSRSISDIDDTLERIPGAVEGRRRLVQTTLQFLDQAAQDAGGDYDLTRTIADGFRKMGDVLGYPLGPSLGDTQGALGSYRKAEMLDTQLLGRYPDRQALWLQWLEVEQRIARLLADLKDAKGGRATYERALSRVQLWRSQSPSNATLALAEAQIHVALSASASDAATDRGHAEAALAILLKLRQESSSRDDLLYELASSYSRLQGSLLRGGELQKARDSGLEALKIREELIARHPDDVTILRDAMLSYGKMGDNLGGDIIVQSLGDSQGALAYYRKALQLAEKISAADPPNQTARRDVAMALMRTAMAMRSAAEQPESIEMLRRSVAIMQDLVKQGLRGSRLANLAMAHEFLGRRLEDAGDRLAAMESYQSALDRALEGVQEDPRDYLSRQQTLIVMRQMVPLAPAVWDRGRAAAFAQKAVDTAQDFFDHGPDPPRVALYLPSMWLARGHMYENLSDRAAACESYRQSVESARRVSAATVLTGRAKEAAQQAEQLWSACQ